MPFSASAAFARLAAEEDDLVVVRSRSLTLKLLAEAERAGYDLTVYYSVQKAHNSMGGNTAQTTRERLVREYAVARRSLAHFMAGLRTKQKAECVAAEGQVDENVC